MMMWEVIEGLYVRTSIGVVANAISSCTVEIFEKIDGGLVVLMVGS